MKKEFYGIDLGTTYSCISVVDSDDFVRVIPNKKGQMVTPSVVHFDDNNNIIVGQLAKSHLVDKPESTVALIKREMSNKDFTVTINGKTYDPIDISSFILKYLVDFANEKRKNEEGKDPIYDVVITVPAYFGNLENTRTKEAGQKAGLNVLQLIDEPTAAAMSYGQKQSSDKKVLVYDLGGGTFDVSILSFKGGIMNVDSTRGNHHLGGADWDIALAQLAMKKLGLSYDEMSDKEKKTILSVAEEAKKELTELNSATLQFNYKGIRAVEVTREEFDRETASLLNTTILLVEEALAAANLEVNEIDEIILVGGSSLMTMVGDMIRENFKIEPKLVDPHMAVSKGAALTALQKDDPERVSGGIAIGVRKGSCGYGLKVTNVELNRELCFSLIKRDDNLITKESFEFATQVDGQTQIQFVFYETRSNLEWKEIDANEEIKGREDYISWGKPVPAGTTVKVNVERDENGCVSINAECAGAKGEFHIVTEASKLATK